MKNKDNKRILVLLVFLIILLVAPIVYLTYFTVFKAEDIINHPANRRSELRENSVKRGTIYDRNHEVLAYSNGTLTTDTNLQEKTRLVLSNKSDKGSVVIMNPKTGEILSMVSLPDFNSQNIAKDMQSINEANNGALFNSSTKGKFAPGSVYKIITTTAILESGISQKYTDEGVEKIDNGREFRNAGNKTYGRVDLKKAFTNSLNTYFVRKSVDMGIDVMAEVSERYMVNKKVDFELPLETSTWDYKRNGFDRTALGAAGIGHDTLLVTPLEMCMVASTIANDGVMMQPKLVKSITDKDEKNVYKAKDEKLSIVTSKSKANTIRDMMVDVVNEGTGKAAYIDGIQVAGKTGTADKSNGLIDAWFVGFAPAYDPQIAVAIVVEDANDTGGVTVAPIARNLLVDIFNQVNLN